VARANGATTTYAYDAADRLADLSTVVSSTLVSDFAYQTDRLGQRVVVTETLGYTGLAADIQSGSGSSSPSAGVTIGNTYFFSANDGSHGSELWKSDGTAIGTLLVKDIQSGSSGSSPSLGNAAVMSSTLFFSANDGTNGTELWKSDSSAAGTVLVKDIRAGSSGSLPNNLTVVNGTLFFTANDGTNGTELWKSDGTTAGTVLVKDIQSGSGSSLSGNLTVLNGTLLFTAFDGTNGAELWKSNGTTAGTVLVKDIQTGSGWSSPGNFVVMNNVLFLSADNGTNGTELWQSDGTTAGTVLVKDVRSGSSGSSPASLKALNGTLLFTAFDGTNGSELWKSDGTTAGTVLVKDIWSGGSSSAPANLTALNSTLLFTAFDGTNGSELWKSDGTTAGTVMVKDINPSLSGTAPGSLTVANNAVFFTADNGTAGKELWVSDGTATGTVMVKDIRSGSSGSNPVNLRAGAGRLFVSANDGTHGQELWTSLGSNRAVQYSYDGLQRLTDATEAPGTSYAYAYDDVGNRTGVWLNGTRTITQTFNAANQVDGFSYDEAGNLTDDGTATYSYDPLGRLGARDGVSYGYNGDGALVARYDDDTTTSYAQDLAAPLSQILQTTQMSTTTNYLYGLDRLAAQTGSAKTWYVGDALGSVRQTLDDAGVPLSVVNYDPWGTPESGTVPTFGFTGELQDAATGLVNLRARWYATGQGRFASRDPFEGYPEQPYSLHQYQYAYNDPMLWTDPSGQTPATGDCKQKTDLCASELTTLKKYKLGIEPGKLCDWNLSELQMVRSAIESWTTVASWLPSQFHRAVAPNVPVVQIIRYDTDDGTHGHADSDTKARIYLHPKTFREATAGDNLIVPVAVVHELSHIWSWAWEGSQLYNGLDILHGFVQATGGSWNERQDMRYWFDSRCPFYVTCVAPTPIYHPQGHPASVYGAKDGSSDPGEDWAESVTATVYPDYHWYKEPTITIIYGGRAGGRTVKLPTMDQERQEYVYAMFRAFRH
jgi:RHS repeat-associated protein